MPKFHTSRFPMLYRGLSCASDEQQTAFNRTNDALRSWLTDNFDLSDSFIRYFTYKTMAMECYSRRDIKDIQNNAAILAEKVIDFIDNCSLYSGFRDSTTNFHIGQALSLYQQILDVDYPTLKQSHLLTQMKGAMSAKDASKLLSDFNKENESVNNVEFKYRFEAYDALPRP